MEKNKMFLIKNTTKLSTTMPLIWVNRLKGDRVKCVDILLAKLLWPQNKVRVTANQTPGEGEHKTYHHGNQSWQVDLQEEELEQAINSTKYPCQK